MRQLGRRNHLRRLQLGGTVFAIRSRALRDLSRDRPTIRLLFIGLSVIGYALCGQALLRHGILYNGGEGGGDVIAYWTAGRHVLAGSPLYGPGVGGTAAFLYPPPLAQAFALLGLAPFPVAVWAWRGVEMVALRVAVGSWRNVGFAMFWTPCISEIDAANVHLILAAAVAMAIRGDARGVVPSALTKFASLAVLPLAMTTDRRGLAIGIVTAVVVCTTSFVLGSALWFEYVRFMANVPVLDSGWAIGAPIPLWLRLGVATFFAIAAVRWRRLAAVAATLALPVLWYQGLSVLIAGAARPAAAVKEFSGTSEPRGRAEPRSVVPG